MKSTPEPRPDIRVVVYPETYPKPDNETVIDVWCTECRRICWMRLTVAEEAGKRRAQPVCYTCAKEIAASGTEHWEQIDSDTEPHPVRINRRLAAVLRDNLTAATRCQCDKHRMPRGHTVN